MREIASLYAERTKRRWINGCLTTLVSLPIMCCCLILLPTVVFPALDSVAAGGNENTTMFVILGIGLVALVGLIGVPVVIALVMITRRARSLDAIFTPLGLSGGTYMLYGRHYQGQIGGREVDIYIYRGPTVDLRLKTTVQTRVQVMAKGSLPASVARGFNKLPLVTNDPALETFAIYPLDETWARGLLVDSRATEAIQTLMTIGAAWAVFRHVEIQPGEVLLNLYRSRQTFSSPIELSAVQIWLAALQALAQAAESQPAPEVTAQPFSTSSRQSMNKFLMYAVVFIVFIMPLCFIGIGVIAYLAVTLLG